MKKLRAVLIDPIAKAVTEIEIKSDYREIYKAIDCETFAVPVTFDEGDSLYVDDEGLFKNPEHFFSLKCWPHPICGKALILGVDDEGNGCDAKIDINVIKDQISWMNRAETKLLQRSEREALNRLKKNPPKGMFVVGSSMADVTGDLDEE